MAHIYAIKVNCVLPYQNITSVWNSFLCLMGDMEWLSPLFLIFPHHCSLCSSVINM